jgi:Flp pilus assembly protein TadD
MSFWKKLFGGEDDEGRVDYYEEGMELLSDGKFHEALTSFRLALKELPGDPVVLQQIAIAYTRIGMTDEAAKTYRHVLQKDPKAAGAHYGLAFLLIRSGQAREAVPHLKAFLADPPPGTAAAQHVAHANSTLAQLTGQADDGPADSDTP